MRRSLVELHVHLVWATWDRLACLDPGICERVHAAIAAKATALGCQRVTVGGVADHVHVLLTLPATLAVAKHYSDMWRRDRRAVNSYSFS